MPRVTEEWTFDSLTVETEFNPPTACVDQTHFKATTAIPRSKLAQDNLKPYPIKSTEWKVWDTLQQLPTTSSSDDLGLYPGTWGTTPWMVRTADVKATSPTVYAACEVELPAEYVDGETVTLRALAGMITTVADTSATIDFEVFKKGETGASVGSDICATSATTLNSLTFGNIDFTITPTGLVAGSMLQVRMKIAVVDAATATAVIAAVEQVKLLCDVKG